MEALERRPEGGALAEIESSRAIQEVQAAMVIAKKFPRDIDAARTRILKACERQILAENAMYSYPKGGTRVDGPSIRLAEAIAQNWGNVQFGIRELSQEGGASEVEAFAWDIETNTRQIKTFQVKHERKARGEIYKLEDPREIYELVANNGARRLRACILGIIPGDVVDEAVSKCKLTLETNAETPFMERLAWMCKAFNDEFGIGEEILADYLGHKVEASNEHELVRLRGVYGSIRDGMSTPEDHFNVEEVKEGAAPTASSTESPAGGEPSLAPPGQEKTPPPSQGEEKKPEWFELEGDAFIEYFQKLNAEDPNGAKKYHESLKGNTKKAFTRKFNKFVVPNLPPPTQNEPPKHGKPISGIQISTLENACAPKVEGGMETIRQWVRDNFDGNDLEALSEAEGEKVIQNFIPF